MEFATDATLEPNHLQAIQSLLDKRVEVTARLKDLGISIRAINAMFVRANEMVQTRSTRSDWSEGLLGAPAAKPHRSRINHQDEDQD